MAKWIRPNTVFIHQIVRDIEYDTDRIRKRNRRIIPVYPVKQDIQGLPD